MRLKLEEIVSACGGKLIGGSPETVITNFVTDSREAKAGSMFVPIVGENVDSHNFISNVFKQGAAASFTEREIEGISAEYPLVLVNDARLALQKAAAYYRSGFDIPIIGVTGSAGKTTAKEMIALALSAKLNVMKTHGNANSQVGVPITICGLKKEHEAAVVEMGVSMPGEMDRISDVVKATHVVVSNIGVSHIEYLKSRENIMAEKMKSAKYVTNFGSVFVSGDDDLLPTLKESFGKRLVTYGLNSNCDWRATDIRDADGGTHFLCVHPDVNMQFYVPASGAHNVRNALAAIAVAHTLDVDMNDVQRALASYKPPAMRQEIFESNGVTIIDDSYNANPDSMKAAIDILSGMSRTGRKIAVLGDMLELGSYTESGHIEVGEYAKKHGIDYVIGVGELSKNICLGFGDNSFSFDSNEQATAFLMDKLRGEDMVLIKGSRGMKMDEIVKSLR